MELINNLKQKTHYELRGILNGFGITLSAYCQQFHEVGTNEYITLYKKLFDDIRELKEQANKGVNTYEVTAQYKQKGKKEIFGYAGTYEERNEDEVKQRLKEKQWRNLQTNKKIKPEFLNITISPTFLNL
jgi:L-rhamnose mutarotase